METSVVRRALMLSNHSRCASHTAAMSRQVRVTSVNVVEIAV